MFALDWYTETGELLDCRDEPTQQPGEVAMQVLPSGPGFTTEPNLRLFNLLIYRAERRLSIVSPYFIPDESLLIAITSAAQRGVEVELFASAKADQFMVHHAQRSYYRALTGGRGGDLAVSRRRRCCTPSSSPSTTTSR